MPKHCSAGGDKQVAVPVMMPEFCSGHKGEDL